MQVVLGLSKEEVDLKDIESIITYKKLILLSIQWVNVSSSVLFYFFYFNPIELTLGFQPLSVPFALAMRYLFIYFEMSDFVFKLDAARHVK